MISRVWRLPNRLLGRIRDDESGISALMVVASIMALFGSASIAVDAGNLWASRRNVIAASDAAALGAAADYAVGQHGCASASDLVTANDPDASLVHCNPNSIGGIGGYVRVKAETPVDFAFASVLGFSDRTVGAETAAGWGIPSAVRGLRPFGLCEDEPQFAAWATNPRGISGVSRIHYGNEPAGCGGAPGNWGLIDLDYSSPVSDSDLQAWTRTGYAGSVRRGNIGGNPGAFHNSYDDDLGAVIGERFPIPVFDRIVGAGSTSKFHIVGFVNVELVGWRTTGAEADRFLEVRFVEMVAAGECCDPGGRNFGLRVIHICDVDPDFDAENCTS